LWRRGGGAALLRQDDSAAGVCRNDPRLLLLPLSDSEQLWETLHELVGFLPFQKNVMDLISVDELIEWMENFSTQLSGRSELLRNRELEQMAFEIRTVLRYQRLT
jgi:hypothetical protein